MKRIEIVSCDDCKFSYIEDVEDSICGLSDPRIDITKVERGRVHKDCPLRSGPVQFCLSHVNAGANDIARTKKCRDCGRNFDITYGELQFLADKFGDTYGEPTRCRPCRKVKKINGDDD